MLDTPMLESSFSWLTRHCFSLPNQLVPLLAQEKGGGAGEGSGLGALLSSPLAPLMLIFVVGYFLLMRPEKRRRAEMAEMLKNLKKNDRVQTIGGICGVVVNVSNDEDEVTLRVDETSNTRIRVLRSAVSKVVTEESAKEKE